MPLKPGKELGLSTRPAVTLLSLTLQPPLLDQVDGFRREFDINDTSLQHTYAVRGSVCVWVSSLPPSSRS